jgi:hypothetical protein
VSMDGQWLSDRREPFGEETFDSEIGSVYSMLFGNIFKDAEVKSSYINCARIIKYRFQPQVCMSSFV